MIPARKSPRFERWFAGHVTGRITRELQRVQVAGRAEIQEALRRSPVLLVSNHTSWWDVMFSVWVAHRLVDRCDAFAMMDAANLRRLPFFARMGAFGMEREQAGQGLARESIDYAAGLLSHPGRLVWIFPQGDERPSTLRPLGFRRGAAVVAHARPEALVVPLAFRYELMGTAKPYAWLSFGPPVDLAVGRAGADVGASTAALEAAVTAQLDRIDRHLCHGPDPDFETVHRLRPGRLERLAEWGLARLNRRHARAALAPPPPLPRLPTEPAAPPPAAPHPPGE